MSANATPTRDWTKGKVLRNKSLGIRADIVHEDGRHMALCWGLSTSKAAQQNSAKYKADCDAIASRFVACWNRMLPFTTEQIEAGFGEDDSAIATAARILNVELLKERAELLAALKGVIEVIDAAGLINLMNGVQLGQTAWYVKATDATEAARAAIADVKAER